MRVAVIGCGNMGLAFARLFVEEHDVVVFDHHQDRTDDVARETGAVAAISAETAIEGADIVLVAIKPEGIAGLAKMIGSKLSKDQIVLSIAVGYPAEPLRKLFSKCHVARAMPNIAIEHGSGVIGMEDDPDLGQEVRAKIEEVLGAAGIVVWLPPHKIEMVGALAGSGVAFVLMMIEAMADAGITMGLSADEALGLASQTFLGAADMVQVSGCHPGDLRWRVSSPGGTTVEGVNVLESAAARSAMTDAVLASYECAIEDE